MLAAEGDYQSIIAPGAAGRLSADDIERARPVIEAADALILQLEIAAESRPCRRDRGGAGRMVVLNASPAPEGWDAIPASLRQAATVLVVNRVEAGRLGADGATMRRGVATLPDPDRRAHRHRHARA